MSSDDYNRSTSSKIDVSFLPKKIASWCFTPENEYPSELLSSCPGDMLLQMLNFSFTFIFADIRFDPEQFSLQSAEQHDRLAHSPA